MGKAMRKTAAVIVAFNPHVPLLSATIKAVSAQVDQVYIWWNSPRTSNDWLADPKVEHLGDGVNRGIGVAHNHGCVKAFGEGFNDVLLIDQDSSPPPCIVEKLQSAARQARRVGGNPAAIGPAFDVSKPGYKQVRVRVRGRLESTSLLVVDFLPSSGTLLSRESFVAVGPFNESFFMDAVDIEWCFRARRKGFGVYQTTDTVMQHRLGERVEGNASPRLARQQPLRIYTFTRNQTMLWSLSHVPTRYKLRMALRVLAELGLSFSDKVSGLQRRRAIWRGFNDGLKGRGGPPPDNILD